MNKKLTIFLTLSLFLLPNISLAFTPNDPYYSNQWYLNELNMPVVWDQSTGSSEVIIAVIDSGVDIDHPDLKNNIWRNNDEVPGDGIDNDNNGYADDLNGWDFIDDDNDPHPNYSADCLNNNTCIEEAIYHGTFVSGVAAAVTNNAQGISGISWKTKIMPIRVLDSSGIGSTLDVVNAINYAVNNGADIINLSFVGEVFDDQVELAVNNAYNQGKIIVAAGGNEGDEGVTLNLDIVKRYPICHSGKNNLNTVLGVGATTQDKQLAQFSNNGSDCIDVMAPGDRFFGAIVVDQELGLDEYYGGDFAGTSASAPIVSGLAALLLAHNPDLTNQQIYNLILYSADNIDQYNPEFAGTLGNGLINPTRMFKYAQALNRDSKLIKSSADAVYYYGTDGKRYVFPNVNIYNSWFNDFSQVKQISDQELADIPFGGNITFKPGKNLVKIQTDPKVYAVAHNGELRWLKTEYLAEFYYGKDWQKLVVDLSDAFFINYTQGEPIDTIDDYDPLEETAKSFFIDLDKGIL